MSVGQGTGQAGLGRVPTSEYVGYPRDNDVGRGDNYRGVGR